MIAESVATLTPAGTPKVPANCPRCEGNLIAEWDTDVRRNIRECIACGWNELSPTRTFLPVRMSTAGASAPAEVAVPAPKAEAPIAPPVVEPVVETPAAPEPGADLLTRHEVEIEYGLTATQIWSATRAGMLHPVGEPHKLQSFYRADIDAWLAAIAARPIALVPKPEPTPAPTPEPTPDLELTPEPTAEVAPIAPATEPAPDVLMSASEVAAEFGITANRVYNAALVGHLRVATRGRNNVRYRRADVLAWRASATDTTNRHKRAAAEEHTKYQAKQVQAPVVAADPLVAVLAEYRKVKAELLATEGEVRVFEGKLADARYLAGLLGLKVDELKGLILEGLL